MLEMKCPHCGSPAEPDGEGRFDAMLYGTGQFSGVHATLHRLPLPLRMARLAAIAGRELYKRAPGLGAKRCTNAACGHSFK